MPSHHPTPNKPNKIKFGFCVGIWHQSMKMRTMLDANQIRLSHFAWRSRIARSSVLVGILLALLCVGGVGDRAPCNHTIQYPVIGMLVHRYSHNSLGSDINNQIAFLASHRHWSYPNGLCLVIDIK